MPLLENDIIFAYLNKYDPIIHSRLLALDSYA